MFVPRPLETVQVDKIIVKLYPVVGPAMKPPECVHAFQTNKATLAVPDVDCRMMLDTLGAQLNLSAIVDGVLSNWNHHFHRNWCNFANLTVISFHNDAGAQVNDTTTANNLAVLLPVIAGAVTACWKQHIHFVFVQMNLDFASLVTLDHLGMTVLQVEFYIELPQGSGKMINNNSAPYCLTTYLGPDDIRTLPSEVFSRNIFGVTLQDGPINLLCLGFNLTVVKTDSMIIKAKINMKVICLTTPSVIDHLFIWLCPGYSKEPHTAFDHIWQFYSDSNGNTVFSSVFEYYTQILASSRPFSDQEVLPISICQAFMDSLDSCPLAGF